MGGNLGTWPDVKTVPLCGFRPGRDMRIAAISQSGVRTVCDQREATFRVLFVLSLRHRTHEGAERAFHDLWTYEIGGRDRRLTFRTPERGTRVRHSPSRDRPRHEGRIYVLPNLAVFLAPRSLRVPGLDVATDRRSCDPGSGRDDRDGDERAR